VNLGREAKQFPVELVNCPLACVTAISPNHIEFMRFGPEAVDGRFDVYLVTLHKLIPFLDGALLPHAYSVGAHKTSCNTLPRSLCIFDMPISNVDIIDAKH